MSKIITYNSEPIYDGWGVTGDLWDANDWLNWLFALRNKYGKIEGDNIWARAWLAGVSVAGGGTGEAPGADYVFDSVPVGERTNNKTFRNFLNAEGNEYIRAVVFTGIGGAIGEVVSTGVEAVSNVTEAAGNVVKNLSNTADNTSKTISYLIPALLIIGGVFIVILANKKVHAL